MLFQAAVRGPDAAAGLRYVTPLGSTHRTLRRLRAPLRRVPAVRVPLYGGVWQLHGDLASVPHTGLCAPCVLPVYGGADTTVKDADKQ